MKARDDRRHRDRAFLLPKPIDNSQIVREVDPRSRRDLVLLLVLMAVLVGGLALYAWPHFEMRQVGLQADLMNRERERLIEENRKLRLEKATLENLRRVERIAVKQLGLVTPAPEQIVVVERQGAPPESARLASEKPAAEAPPSGGPRLSDKREGERN